MDRVRKPLIWLLSAYHADSHAAWAERLMRHFDQVEWRPFSLPGRHFRWRIRGNPLSWLDTFPDECPDLILATSMVDLATLKGLHPRYSPVPTVYYFHENQFTYPRNERQHDSVDPQMVQLYGALAADRIAFNSAFNRNSFLQGVADLLQRLPDALPTKVEERLAKKSTLCPVPISPPSTTATREAGLILWSHRWEYDKNPDLFADAVLALAEQGRDFRLALLGPRPAKAPPALHRLRDLLPGHIAVDARVTADEYTHWLSRADIVVSTARHEFQGLAVLEAAAAGALPLVPDALCYPEQYPKTCRYTQGDRASLTDRLTRWLAGERPPQVDVSAWHGNELWKRWRSLLMTAHSPR